MGSTPESAGDDELRRSRDEEAVGWGDERADFGADGNVSDSDPDVARLLADRPPHHDRG